MSRREPHDIALYFRDAPPHDLFPSNSKTKLVVIPWRRAWTHLRFAGALWATRPDVCFVPAHTLPGLFPGKAVVTVHDLGYKHFPSAHPITQRAYLDMTTAYSQRRATLVLADSRATAADLRRFYGTPEEKIRILYPGVDADTLQIKANDISRVRDRHRLPQRYFLFIGTLQPRKNVQGLVRAFELWQQQVADVETELVLAGGKGWLFDESWLSGVERVRTLGYIEDSDKGALMSGALALVFPSFYEGFGFPVVEAMICGTPVIASDSSSLPELVGEAGLLVDPHDVNAISAAMRQCSDDSKLRESLIRKGKQQAAAFTWQRAAKQLHVVFDEIQHMQ